MVSVPKDGDAQTGFSSASHGLAAAPQKKGEQKTEPDIYDSWKSGGRSTGNETPLPDITPKEP